MVPDKFTQLTPDVQKLMHMISIFLAVAYLADGSKHEIVREIKKAATK